MRLRLAILTALACAGLFLAGAAPADDEVPPPPEGEEIQARGQVHEAFAEATETRGEPGVVVSTQPPEVIDEMPPEEKPEGDHVVWIPGYWSHDEEAKDFIWISGFWRAVPPGREWVPGSWQKTEDGYQWVSGYWAVEGQTEEAEYLPPPPNSLDAVVVQVDAGRLRLRLGLLGRAADRPRPAVRPGEVHQAAVPPPRLHLHAQLRRAA